MVIGYCARFDRQVFWAVFLATAVYFVTVRADFFFGPATYEAGDFAADALQIIEAKHGRETLGPYSRWRFHHPGPAFFYVYAGGEFLFYDLLGIVSSPHNAHVLTGVLLQSFFFASSIAILSYYHRRWRFVLLVLILALIHFRLTEHAFLSIWTTHQLLLPFLCMILAGASVATGRLRHLPLLALASGFLIHGHVAQMLFVGAVWFVVSLLFLSRWRRWRRVISLSAVLRRLRGRNPLLLATVTAAVFSAPLVLEALHGRHGNFAAILDHMRSHSGERNSLNESIFYFAQFLTYWGFHDLPEGNWKQFVTRSFGPLSLWLLVFLTFTITATVLFACLRRPRHPLILRFGLTRRMVSYFGCVCVVALTTAVASIIWGVKIAGEMWAFNSFFNYSILFAFILPGALMIDVAFRSVPRLVLAAEICGLGAVAAMPGRFTILSEVQNGNASHQKFARLVSETGALPKRHMLLLRHSVWPRVAALALDMQRNGVDFAVPPEWSFMFGKTHEGSLPEALRAPERNAVWVLGTEQELAPNFETLIDLGGGCYAQDLHKLRKLSVPAIIMPDAEAYFMDGFHAAESGFRWTAEHHAWMFLPLNPPENGMKIEFVLNGLTQAPRKPNQRVIVSIGSLVVANWNVSDEDKFVLDLPREFVKNQVKVAQGILLDFEIPDACSPKSIGINDDTRMLGIAFHQIRLL